MAIDTTQVGDFEYPGEEGEEVGTHPPALRPGDAPTGSARTSCGPSSAVWSAISSATGWATSSPAGTPRCRTRARTTSPSCSGCRSEWPGWMAGIGALNYPLAKILGYELSPHPPEPTWARYFRMTDDHKVVGMQYAVGVLLFLFTGGLLAMLIRTELLSPTNHVFGPGTYIAIVGEHGTIMMMMASSAVVGPLGNWLIPLMIGSRRMAYPRVEAFSFWIFMAGYLVIVSALFFGGFPTGWTGYAPLQTQAAGRNGLLSRRLRGHRDRHDPGRLQPGRHHHQLPGSRHDLEPAAHLRLGASWRPPRCSRWPRRRSWSRDCSGSSTAPPRPRSSSTSTAAATSCGRTSSGSSATPRSTSWPCRVSGSSWRSCRSSPASPSSPTRWRQRACSGWRSCPSSSGSTTSSRAGSTRTCGRSSC